MEPILVTYLGTLGVLPLMQPEIVHVREVCMLSEVEEGLEFCTIDGEVECAVACEFCFEVGTCVGGCRWAVIRIGSVTCGDRFMLPNIKT